MRRPEIWTPRPRSLFPFGPAPPGHRAMVAGEQHLRDFPALEETRPGVLRMLEEVVLEALLAQPRGLAQHAGQQPHRSLDRHQGRRLAAGDYRVPDRDL